MKNKKINPTIVSFILFVLALITGWLAYTMAQPTIQLLALGTRTVATVVEVVEVHQTDFDGFSPVVSFDDERGNPLKIQCKFSTGQPTWKVGDKLEIIYPPGRPKEAQTTHWWDLWGFSIIPFAASVVFLLISITGFFNQFGNKSKVNSRQQIQNSD